MNEYEYTIEIYAVKSLRVKANTEEEADRTADLITTTETIPLKQDDIIEIMITDVRKCEDDENEVQDRKKSIPEW